MQRAIQLKNGLRPQGGVGNFSPALFFHIELKKARLKSFLIKTAGWLNSENNPI